MLRFINFSTEKFIQPPSFTASHLLACNFFAFFASQLHSFPTSQPFRLLLPLHFHLLHLGQDKKVIYFFMDVPVTPSRQRIWDEYARNCKPSGFKTTGGQYCYKMGEKWQDRKSIFVWKKSYLYIYGRPG
jgi:hypothetical protein